MTVVTWRKKESTQVVGTAEDHEAAVALAVKFLQEDLGIEIDELDGLSWEEAVERWDDLSDGYEEFTFTETDDG